MNRKKRRRHSKSIVIKTVTYVVLILLLFLLIVFIVSRFDKPPEDEVSDTGITAADSKTIGTASNSVGSQGGNESEILIITTAEETEGTDELADNEWALYLVNNENSLPADYDNTLENEIGLTLVFSDYRDYFFDDRAAPYLIKMLEDSAEDGVNLYVVSTYRTQEYQQNNLDSSVNDRMAQGMDYDTAYADALESVALPGHSEHNAGLAADIMTPSYTSMEDDGFKNTEEYEWLSKNAAKYGFILRYPEGKQNVTGIIYEPWHYRFVGVYHATKIAESGLTLEEYFKENGWVDENGKATKHLGPIAEDVPAANDSPAVTLPPDMITVTVNTEMGNPILVE
ncbi:MAG: M15 family metallopeptidase [Ruminococcus sp.]|jgi:D-alanyl-D-alanine carboxypeptidase|nr:M15 family metallopeptidase [Ruminococcus sp.]